MYAFFIVVAHTPMLYFDEKSVINAFLRFLFINLTIVTSMNTKSSAFVLVIFSSSMRCECFSIIHQLAAALFFICDGESWARAASQIAVLGKGFVSESSDRELKPCRVVLEFNCPSSRKDDLPML